MAVGAGAGAVGGKDDLSREWTLPLLERPNPKEVSQRFVRPVEISRLWPQSFEGDTGQATLVLSNSQAPTHM